MTPSILCEITYLLAVSGGKAPTFASYAYMCVCACATDNMITKCACVQRQRERREREEREKRERERREREREERERREREREKREILYYLYC